MLGRTRQRAGLTLVELIVVIAIIGVLATLTALYFPRFQAREFVQRGTDKLSGWLLIARQQARRDGKPTGVRLLVNNNGIANKLQYIQQPDDFAQGMYLGPDPMNNKVAIFSVDMTNLGIAIEAGDYLEIYGGGVPRRIAAPPTAAMNTRLTLDPSTTPLPSLGTAPTGTVTNYRIIPQPRPIPGEQDLILSEDNDITVAVDMHNGRSVNVPARTSGGVVVHEILFGPSGAVIGTGTTNSQIILWVRDVTRNSNPANVLDGDPLLVTIQPRTGFVATHPVSSGADPYAFAKDARSSGM